MSDQTMQAKRESGVRIPTQWILAVVVPALFFGVIGVGQLTGWWRTSNVRVPRVISQTSTGTVLYNPADIRGSSRLSEIEGFFGVPAALIAEAFGFVTDNPAALTAKAIDELYGEIETADGRHLDVGTDAVKYFVALMTGLPFTPAEGTGLPSGAIDIILSSGAGMEAAQREALLLVEVEQRSLVLGGVGASAAPAAAPAAAAAPVNFTFQGRTTFAEVMAAGLSRAQIESVLGRPMGPPSQTVREFAEQNGLTYSAVRNGLTSLMEAQR